MPMLPVCLAHRAPPWPWEALPGNDPDLAKVPRVEAISGNVQVWNDHVLVRRWPGTSLSRGWNVAALMSAFYDDCKWFQHPRQCIQVSCVVVHICYPGTQEAEAGRLFPFIL